MLINGNYFVQRLSRIFVCTNPRHRFLMSCHTFVLYTPSSFKNSVHSLVAHWIRSMQIISKSPTPPASQPTKLIADDESPRKKLENPARHCPFGATLRVLFLLEALYRRGAQQKKGHENFRADQLLDRNFFASQWCLIVRTFCTQNKSSAIHTLN